MFKIEKIILCITLGICSTQDFYLLVKQDNEVCFVKTNESEVIYLKLPVDTQYVATRQFKIK